MHYFDSSKRGRKFERKPNDRPRVPQETLHKTPVTEEPGAKEHVQFTDHPHAMDITQSSAEKEVNKQTSVSKATETKDVLTSHSYVTGTMNSDGFVVNKDHLTGEE